MSAEFTIGPKPPGSVESMVASDQREARITHIDRAFLPDHGKENTRRKAQDSHKT